MLPRPPPKDQFLSPNSDYINQDLAEAVRDSVRIKSSSSNRSNNSYSPAQQLDDPHTNTGARRTPSPNPPRPINVVNPPKPSYDDLSPSWPEVDNFDAMASDPASGQPALPSTRMQQLQNPFEEDEIEPVGTGPVKPPGIRNFALEENGTVHPRRTKFSRAQTGWVSFFFSIVLGCVVVLRHVAGVLGFSFGQSRVFTWHSGMWGEFAIER